jgi:hypothetical protein
MGEKCGVWWKAEWRIRDISEQTIDIRSIEKGGAWMEHGLVLWCGGVRKSGS